MHRRWILLVLLVWASLAAQAVAEPPASHRSTAAVPPEARAAVEKAKRAQEKLGYQGRALGELATQLLALRQRLQHVTLAQTTEAAEVAAGLLEAHAARLETLLEAASEEAKSEPRIRGSIESTRGRFAQVLARVGEIVGQSDLDLRRRQAGALLDELVAEDPRGSDYRKLGPTTFSVLTEESLAIERPHTAGALR